LALTEGTLRELGIKSWDEVADNYEKADYC